MPGQAASGAEERHERARERGRVPRVGLAGTAAALLIAVASSCVLAAGAMAAEYTVTTTADLAGNCTATPQNCSLRQAINSAGAGTNPDAIAVPAGTFELPGGTLSLGATDVTITGAGPGATVITGSNARRVLSASPNVKLTLRGVTVRDANAASSNGGALSMAADSTLTVENAVFEGNRTQGTNEGGAIAFGDNGTASYTDVVFRQNHGDEGGAIFMTFPSVSHYTRVVFERNTSNFDGGAIELFSPNTSTFTDVLFDSNEGGKGGAVFFNSSGPSNPAVTTFRRVTVRGNKERIAGGGGGALWFNPGAEAQFIDSTFSGNTADGSEGGGAMRFLAGARVSLVNTTISGNSVTGGPGGGIQFDNNAVVAVTNSTIAGNSSNIAGGGIAATLPAGVTLTNTLLAGNTAPAGTNCSSPFTSGGGNLESADTCGLGAGELRNTNPLLVPLADNGGATQTHALAPGSPAVNGAVAANCPATDQRGVVRPANACDIGAFELAAPVPATGGASDVSATAATLAGTVIANQRVASWAFDYGRTSAYGASTPPAETGGGTTPTPVGTRVTGLRQDTTYHFRLVASSSDGTAHGADATFRTANLPPVLSRFGMTRRRFEVASGAPRSAARRGSAFRFRLSERATMRITIQRCKKRRRCKRVGVLKRPGKAGANRIPFRGKVKGRALRPGAYRAIAQATDARRARSNKRRVRFRVVD